LRIHDANYFRHVGVNKSGVIRQRKCQELKGWILAEIVKSTEELMICR
jgi:hypothetical protein